MDLSKYKTRSGMTISDTLSDTVGTRKSIANLILEEAAGSKNEEAIKSALATAISDKAESDVESRLSEKISDFCKEFSEEESTNYYYLSDVLFKLGIKATKEIADNFESKGKKKVAERIMRESFPFNKLVDLEPSAIEKIYNETDSGEFSKAMKGADNATREFILSNLPSKVSMLIKEDIEFMGPIRVKDAEESKEKILTTVRNLLLEEKISLAK
ncbi:MAG: hypothetical protein IKN34_02260 [Treponema sp.]|nr:hypothetical protein [Treponema sp.]